MRKIREALSLRLGREPPVPIREVGEAIASSPSTVLDYVRRAEAAGLGWPLPEELSDDALESLLFPPLDPSRGPRRAPDFEAVHAELQRKHVTLDLLWREYRKASADGYEYSQFCALYRTWKGELDVCLRQTYVPGQRALVDFAGDTLPIVDELTGDIINGQLFVAVLGASNFTYARVCPGQDIHSWIEAHVGMWAFFGGVTELEVIDNLKSGVTRPSRYEPLLNRTFEELADHYCVAILPARVRRPKDKAKAENGVLVAERWILARLRNHRLFSVAEANQAVRPLLDELNDRPFKKLPGSRRSRFVEMEQAALRPLPDRPFEFAEWCRPRAGADYHVEVCEHFYSVPYKRKGQRFDARYTAATVELFRNNERIASHLRSRVRGGKTTASEHMPEKHRVMLDWTPERLLEKARLVGPSTGALTERAMESSKHPEVGARVCLGIIRLGDKHGTDRLEAACARAMTAGACSYESVCSILSKGLDRQSLDDGTTAQPRIQHDNIRGATYYQQLGDSQSADSERQTGFAFDEPSAVAVSDATRPTSAGDTAGDTAGDDTAGNAGKRRGDARPAAGTADVRLDVSAVGDNGQPGFTFIATSGTSNEGGSRAH